MNKRQKIIVSITGITLVLLILVGLTYAYFLTRIQGNTNTKSISVTTADLALVYGDGSPLILTGELIQPSNTPIGEKTFTVTNEGNASVEYGVFLEDVLNNFKYTDDLKLVITCSSNISGHTCSGYNGTMPTSNDMLLTNTIDPASTGVEKEIHSYTLTLTYEETGEDQSDDMNKQLEGKIQIYDLNNTVDLAGTVSDASEGDYVVVNSEGDKKSYLRNKKYKVVGLSPDNHTITVYSSNGTERYSKQFVIQKGTEESINGTTFTIIDTTRSVSATVSSGSISTSLIPYEEGTLAYAIINSARNVTSAEKTNLYAEYSPTPRTVPAVDANGTNESTLSVTPDDYGTSYYFRGNVSNNYVNFAGMCWRIVRIEGDGSIKLIHEDSTHECNSASYTGNWSSGLSNLFGYDNDNRADFLNYSGGLADSLKAYQGTLLTKLQTKYENNKLNLSNYLKIDEWCYDDKISERYYFNDNYEEVLDPADATRIDEYYGAYTRFEKNKLPSLRCTGSKLIKYRDDTDMYVSTLTVDELSFAGAKVFNNNTFYLINNYSLNNDLNWLLISPASWNSYDNDGYVYLMDKNTIYQINANNDWDYTYSTRAAISLLSGTTISGGDGTKTNPYVIN